MHYIASAKDVRSICQDGIPADHRGLIRLLTPAGWCEFVRGKHGDLGGLAIFNIDPQGIDDPERSALLTSFASEVLICQPSITPEYIDLLWTSGTP